MTKSPTPKIPTKKHIVRQERDRKQRNQLLIVFGAIMAVVVLVLLYGVLDQTVLSARRPVAQVEDTVIRTNEFQKQVKFQRSQLNQQALQYANFKQLFGGDPNNTAYIDSLIQQIQSQMNNTQVLGEQVLDNMINDVVIAKYAEENGITVSEEEVEKAIREDFGFFPAGTPTPESSPTPYATSTMNPTQYAIITATPVVEETAVDVLPQETPESSGETEPTEAASEPTEEAEATPEDQATATPLPTATPYTESAFEDDFSNMVENFSEIGFSETDIRNLYRKQLLYQKVFEEVTADVATESEQVWARHILVESIQDALAVIQRLDEGEDFASIASDVSTDTSNKDQGGDLGWFGRGVMDPAFEEAAYALNVGEISDPVQSQFGFHIIQLIGKEVRPLNSSQLQQAKDTAFSEWLEQQKEGLEIEKFDAVWQNAVPTEPAFVEGLVQ